MLDLQFQLSLADLKSVDFGFTERHEKARSIQTCDFRRSALRDDSL
jgi:hypothetical protein